jgi:hypothetical protein
MTDRTIHDFPIVVDPSLGPYEMRVSAPPPILEQHRRTYAKPLGVFKSIDFHDYGFTMTLTRTPVAPFKPRQRIAIPGGRIATVESMRRNRAEGTGAFGAWMVEARPDGINPETGKCWPIETHFASECRE